MQKKIAHPKAPAVKPKICQPTSKQANNLLIIFVKYPQPGRVKTRLAKNIGKQNAADIYRLFVEAALKRTKDKNSKRIVFYTPQDKGKEIKEWLVPSFKGIRKDYPLGLGSDGLEFRPQKGRDLGERLFNAFRLSMESSPARRILAIGTDSPLIDRKVANTAFRALETKQCVLGPALDGGYYLIGLSSLKKEVFKGISWGTKKVFAQTLKRLKMLKMSYSLLDTSFDVDRHKDIAYLRQKIHGSLEVNPLGLKPIVHALRRIVR